MKRIIYSSLSVLTVISTAFVATKAEGFPGDSNGQSNPSIAQGELANVNLRPANAPSSVAIPTAQAQMMEAEPDETAPDEGTVTPESDMTDPGLIEPGVSDPDLTEPGMSGPEGADPLLNEPELNEPELNEPELNEPELNELEEDSLREPAADEVLPPIPQESIPPVAPGSSAPGFPPSTSPGFPPAPVEPAPRSPLEENTPLDDSAVPNDDFSVGASSSDRLVGEGFTPFQLSYLAIAGGLKEEGIPGGSVLLSAYNQGDISAADIVEAGALTNRLGTAADEQADYTDGVERFLKRLERDARAD